MNHSFAIPFLSAVILAAGSIEAAPARTAVKDIAPYVSSESYPAGVPTMTMLPDGTTYASLSADGKRIEQTDLATGKVTATLFDVDNTREEKLSYIDGFIINADGSRIIVSTATQSIYRRSTTARHYVYETRSRLLRPLSADHDRQRAPIFSPDGLQVAFVASDNNIYLKKLTYWTEVAVTTDGKVNEVINGVPDWVYEEEFTTSSSMTWSPDSRTLCFLRYDESSVPVYSLPLYGGQCGGDPARELYPGSMDYKYPVAGKPNSVVTVHSYDVDNRKLKQVELPSGRGIEYIPRIAFAHSDDRLMITTLNRAQTRMEIYLANPRSTVAKSIMVEEGNAWLNPATYESVTWLDDSFIVLSGRTGYDHLYRYSYAGSLIGAVTRGDFDVTDYYGYDAARGIHYCQSAATGAINRVVSRVDAKGVMTNLTPAEGTATARFTPGMQSYVLTYSNATTPPVTTVVSARNGKTLATLADNTKGAYASRWAGKPMREFFTFTTAEGVELNGYMIKPKGFDPSRRYPVVMYQYSGPGSQQVLNLWSINWATYYAEQGYIVACVDGRGTGGRGRAFMDAVYKRLGHFETIDQIAAARYIASLPFVDGSRIGMHGWSYGGYETLMAVTADDSPYAAAVAVAPVTDWRFYDTIYAERYMLTPQENETGYEQSAPLFRTDRVKAPLLVMWGTADDNVHPANSIEFIARMESEGNYCDLLLFPNMDHSINGCGSRALVFARMLDYFNTQMK